MATFKNITQEPIEVPLAAGSRIVEPGEEFIGAKRLLAGLVKDEKLKMVSDEKKDESSASKEAPSLVPEQAPTKHRGRAVPDGEERQ